DPGHKTAISLRQIAVALLMTWPDIDRLALRHLDETGTGHRENVSGYEEVTWIRRPTALAGLLLRFASRLQGVVPGFIRRQSHAPANPIGKDQLS
ncbi:MAG TPA: hypothetical protein VMY98_04555, partial [Anaerolineae bacterium]|nr:hypothetical protein [Anaerolineae bacterium]